jgi:hypothetical protein
VFRLRASRVCSCGRAAVVLHQADGWLAASGDHAVGEADVCGALQSACGEDRGMSGGDRYWSRVLDGEPPKGSGEVDWEALDVVAETGEISFEMCPPTGVSPLTAENPAEPCFSPQTPARSPSPPD